MARIRNVTSTGMQIRAQIFAYTGTATAGNIHCVIAEKGLHTLPDGTAFQAGKVVSTQIQGDATNSWNWAASRQEVLTGSFDASLGTPILLASVMTANDPLPSATTTIIPANPSLAVTKIADKTVNVNAGETVVYT